MDNGIVEQIALNFVELRRLLFGTITKQLSSDLPASQCELLLCIEEGPRKVKDVAAAMNVTSGAITQLTDQLENLDLIERFMNEDDRRVVWVRLSEAGQKRLGKLKKYYTEHFAGALYGFNNEELENLSFSLQKIVTNTKAHDEDQY